MKTPVLRLALTPLSIGLDIGRAVGKRTANRKMVKTYIYLHQERDRQV